MRTNVQAMSWVVYLMTIHGKPSGLRAVCEEGEWEAMELAHPGQHTLIQGGICNEGEAERLARGAPVVATKSKPPTRRAVPPAEAVPAAAP